MTTKKYRVAVVGAAGTWGRYYTRAYANNPRCQIVGLVDRAQQRRDQQGRCSNFFLTLDQNFCIQIRHFLMKMGRF